MTRITSSIARRSSPPLEFDNLLGGEKVEFEIEQTPKGPRAAKVHAV